MHRDQDINHLIPNAVQNLYTLCMDVHHKNPCLSGAKNYDLATLRTAIAQYDTIIEIDNEFKLNQYVQNALRPDHQKSIRLDVAAYHDEISLLKITEFEGVIAGVSEASYCITFEFKKGLPKKHFFCKAHNFDESIKLLINNIAEEDIEVISKKQFRIQAKPLTTLFWQSNWEYAEIESHYDEVSDVFMREKVEQYILPLAKKDTPLVLIDVGGGKGRLAIKLIDRLIQEKIPFKYIFIEPDSSQYATAQIKFESYAEQNIEGINTTLEGFSKTEEYKECYQKVHGIILSGGPINENIVDRVDAEKNLRRLIPLLSTHGIILASGLSPVLFTKKDFVEQYHLNVLGTSKRNPSMYPVLPDSLYQCYVLKKQHEQMQEQELNDSSPTSINKL
ncbi:MAG: hypothetical protein LEGION0403_FIIPPAGN_00907 [Legionella sp.]|uniref:hypothetical protein n=1 Tax=Legionella sp. TaxID=459 RepID=UPI003D0A5D8C